MQEGELVNNKGDIRSKTEQLVRILEELRSKRFRTPDEILVTELGLTDLSEEILDEVNSELVNFKLFHKMVIPDHVN